ncbi:MAG: hypothetical protein ABFD69_01560 [Candidatus Sumerlaeia bacterium]
MKHSSRSRLGIGKVEVILIAAAACLFSMAAIPNFGEMRVLSDVARTRRDLAAIAIAMESYHADNSGYPAAYRESPIDHFSTSSSMDRRLLTTPVAYLSKLPFDACRQGSPAYYRFYAVAYQSRITPPYYMRSYTTYPKTAWMAWGLGPDWVQNTGGYFPLPAIIANEALAAPQVGVDLNGNIIGRPPGYNGIPGYNGLRYDPTNGTVSWGDIYRFSALAAVRVN